MPDLENWLKQFGLEALCGVLADNDVDLDILPDLTEADFEKLGISLGHRRKLIKAIASLHGAPVKAAEAVADTPATPPKAAANVGSRASPGHSPVQRSRRFDGARHRA